MHNGPNSSARIMEAALTLFSQKGYDAASTREICALAGISKPTLYYFHKSKEEIYRALVRTAIGDLVALVNTGLRSANDLRTKLKNCLELAFDYANREPRLWRFLFAIGHSENSPFADDAHEFYLLMKRKVSAEVAAAQKAGEIRPGDPNVRVLLLIGAVAETVSNRLVLGSPKLTRKLAHSIIDTILDGWVTARTRASR